MKRQKPAVLLNTLSVRVDDATLARLVASAKREHRRLSDYVRLLLEQAQRHTPLLSMAISEESSV